MINIGLNINAKFAIVLSMNESFVLNRMKELGVTTKSLAENSGVSVGYMELILRGYRPSKSVLLNMARALNCQVADLAGKTLPAATRKRAVG